MDSNLAKLFKRHCIWLSLLCHLLLLLSFSPVWVKPTKQIKEEQPELVVPSYVSREQITPSPQQQEVQKNVVTAKNGLEKAAKTSPSPTQNTNQAPTKSVSKNTDPIHLVGDKNKIAKPLIKILGKALAAKLVFPKMAVDFNLRGTVLIGFVLSPDGRVSEARVVKSSNAGVLDQEALRAINAMSPVKNVGLYVKEPEFLVVGIIFG